MTWSYVKYGDPTDFYIPLPPEKKLEFNYPRRHYHVPRPPPPLLPPPPPVLISPAPLAPTTPPRSHTPTIPIPLSSNVTIRRRPRLHLTHTQFRPYTPPSHSENSALHYRSRHSLNQLPSCKGICSLNFHTNTYSRPVFPASEVLNPLQRCNGMMLRMSPHTTPGRHTTHCNSGDGLYYHVHHEDQEHKHGHGQKRCQLILCTYCVRFLLGWHEGRLGKMLKWWKGWFDRKEKEIVGGEGLESVRPMWNMTWESEHLVEVMRNLKEEAEEKREKSKKGKMGARALDLDGRNWGTAGGEDGGGGVGVGDSYTYRRG